MRIATTTLLCFQILCGAGCASVITRTSPGHSFVSDGAYPGTRAAPQMIHDCRVDSSSDLAVLFCLDFPFTFVFDTLLLPADLLCYRDKASQ